MSDSVTPWTVAYQAPPSMEISKQGEEEEGEEEEKQNWGRFSLDRFPTNAAAFPSSSWCGFSMTLLQTLTGLIFPSAALHSAHPWGSAPGSLMCSERGGTSMSLWEVDCDSSDNFPITSEEG